MRRDTKEIIVFVLIWAAMTVGCKALADKIGGALGGVVGLLFWGLGMATMMIFAYYEYRSEQQQRKDRRKTRDAAERINRAYNYLDERRESRW